MRYLPHTPDEIKQMLSASGLSTLDELFHSIPEDIRRQAKLDMPPPLDEAGLMRHTRELAANNRAADMLNFLGAGAYDHWFPQAADQLLLRSEFYTAYTPYQAEVAQGTLQVIFEFQTIVSEILGLPVANASMYDASTGVAEAVLMARRLTKRHRTIVSDCVHPEYRATVRTYLSELDSEQPERWHQVATCDDGRSDLDALIAALDDETACVVVGYPTFFGTLLDLRPLAEAAKAKGVKLITCTNEPFALALAESPGSMGADIAVAEGQSLGLPPQFGGPGVGLFACTGERKALQQMPGRLCGETVDQDGRRGYVLTLSTREQHIRRERATSNICTNSGLCATALTIKMCMLGKSGFVAAAEQCLAKAEYLRAEIDALPGFEILSPAPTFNEFAIRVTEGRVDSVLASLREQGIVGGLQVEQLDPKHKDILLLAVTEKHRKEDLDRLVAAFKASR
jgi:glycine dehydrogenase subunit 1